MSSTRAMRLIDLLEDVATELARRPGRALLFAVGAALAAGLFSYSAVHSTTAASDVAGAFDELAATRLRVDLPLDTPTYRRLRPEILEALGAIDGVERAVVLGRDDVRLTTVRDPARDVATTVRRYTAVGDLAALHDDLDPHAPGAVLLGGGLAAEHGLRARAHVELDGRPATVAGRLDRSPTATDVLFGVITPAGEEALAQIREGLLVVQVRRGWAERVAGQVAATLNPNRPDGVLVRYPPEAARLRAEVVTRVDGLVLVVALALLLLTGLVVGLATFAHVVQNRRLIGMRRAIGASSGDVALALLLDVVVTSGSGAVFGTLLGTAVAAAAATAGGQRPVVPLGLLLTGVAVAVALNALAAVPPTVRALRIDPARAIQAR